MYSEQGGHWSGQTPAAQPPQSSAERPHLGVFVLVGGFAATLFAMFALPIEDPFKGDRPGTLPDDLPGDRSPFGTIAEIWWMYLGLVMLGVLAVCVAITAAVPSARRGMGWITALLTAATAGLYTFALLQTGNLLQFQTTLRAEGSAFDVAAIGIWVTYGTLGVLLLGCLLTALIRTQPRATPAPLGTGPAGPPPGAPFGAPPPQQPPAPAGWQQSGPPPWQQAQPPNSNY
jgi:hypothetical protein